MCKINTAGVIFVLRAQIPQRSRFSRHQLLVKYFHISRFEMLAEPHTKHTLPMPFIKHVRT